MKIFVKVKSNAKERSIGKISPPSSRFRRAGDTYFVVAVKEPPKDGKANMAVIKALAEFLEIAPSRLILKSGAASRNKIFEIVI